jgi:hypothetical protein
MHDIIYGGGHYICEQCGETIFGSVDHYCNKQKIKMPSLNEIIDKIKQIEKEIGYEYHEIADIISIEFYTDGSGSIHSNEYEYFSFEKFSDLKHFVRLDFNYIMQYRKKYPL